mgnify:FL=1
MYKAVIFDFGNVLCGLDRMAFARAAAPFSRLSAEEFDRAVWGGAIEHDSETGKYDSHGHFERIREATGLDSSYAYERFVEDFSRIILPNPDGEAGLVAARNLGARTFVLSNTSWLHARKIFDNETLASIPEVHILSYKVGMMKPDPRIWGKALEYSGLAAADCLYIDDVRPYCDMAVSLGFGAFCYDKTTQNLSHIIQSMLK